MLLYGALQLKIISEKLWESGGEYIIYLFIYLTSGSERVVIIPAPHEVSFIETDINIYFHFLV